MASKALPWGESQCGRRPKSNPPKGFYRQKIGQIDNNANELFAEHFERLIPRRQKDPVKMDCKPSRKNGEVKITPEMRPSAMLRRSNFSTRGNIRPGYKVKRSYKVTKENAF